MHTTFNFLVRENVSRTLFIRDKPKMYFCTHITNKRINECIVIELYKFCRFQEKNQQY